MLKAAIVGFGRAGKIQLRAVEGIFEIICIVDSLASVSSFVPPSIPFESNLEKVLEREDIDVVIITTPTETHFDICRKALLSGTHVFVEKPLANSISEIEALYALCYEKNCMLYTAYNRRCDPEWLALKKGIADKTPLHANVLCRDFPYPPPEYLRTCGGIFRDAAVHDLDMLCLLFDDTPVEVNASLDEAKETSSCTLKFSKGCEARLIHSRHSDYYDQRVMVVCDKGIVEFGGSVTAETASKSFADRYSESYVAQMKDFSERLRSKTFAPNVDLSHALFIEKLVNACDESARQGLPISLQPLRQYDDTQNRVYNVYLEARKFHTVERTRQLCKTYAPKQHGTYSIWQVMEALEMFVDISDPDVDVPNMQHALQTAESLRRANLPEWLQLCGLIHDFGKMMYKWGCDADGTSLATQWSIVGDTFIVGTALPSCLIYPEFNEHAPEKYEGLGIYQPHCGLDACEVSFGHDEYLYNILLASKTKLPSTALKIIRYHSLYAWHDKNAYSDLENEQDVLLKGWVKLFNQHDLYSKTNKKIVLDDVKEHYERLAATFLPSGLWF